MSAAELLARARALLGDETATLETLFTSPDYFGVTTATPLQRAICRIADGVPLGELAAHEHVGAALGDVAALPRSRALRIMLLAGIRAAKSLLAGAAAVRQSQIVDISHLKPGEIPRVSVVAPRLDLADVVRSHVHGHVLARPKLRALLLEEPKADSLLLRHPSGRPVEIKTVAGSAAGSTLVSRWSAGVIFDEAPRMVGGGEGVVNLDDMRTAVQGRLLPGAAEWDIGSPWAPFGPVYRDVSEHHGKPSADLVVIRAQGPWMNPVWWTTERCEELRRRDPTAYRTDVLAEFVDPEEAFLPSAAIDACTRKVLVEERRPRHEYVAAMDPASRGNAWTLVIATRRNGKRVVAKARQWLGNRAKPLDPEEVLGEIAAECRAYGIDAIETDQWSTDALRALARRFGLALVEWPMTQAGNVEAYLDFARRALAGEIELPPDAQIRADLLRVKKRVTQGGLAMVLPETSDGRHCDYAPAIVRACRRACAEAVLDMAPDVAAAVQAKREEAEALRRAEDRFAPKRERGSWRRRP